MTRIGIGLGLGSMPPAPSSSLFIAPEATWDGITASATPTFSELVIDPETPALSWIYADIYDGASLIRTAKKQLSQADIDGGGPWTLSSITDLPNGTYDTLFYTMDEDELVVTSHVSTAVEITINVSAGIVRVGYALSTVPQAAVASYTIPLTGLTAYGGGAAGDVQIGDTLVISYSETSAGDVALSIDSHASLTGGEVVEVFGDDSNDNNQGVAIFRVTGTPPATITINGTANAANGNSAIMRVYRGVNATPEDVTATTAFGNNTSAANGAAITPVTAGAVVVAFYAATQTNLNTGTFEGAAPSGWDNVVPLLNSGGSTRRLLMVSFDRDWTSGAVDPPEISPGDVGLSHSWTAITIALRPA